MRKSIVTKLFLLTSGLCILIITGIFLGQTIFFRHFYVRQKVSSVQNALHTMTQPDWADSEDAFHAEQRFYEEQGAWVALLDGAGILAYADDFAIEVKVEQATGAPGLVGRSITVPLYTVVTIDEFERDTLLLDRSFLSPGSSVVMEGLWIDGRFFPHRVARSISNLRDENRLENTQLVNKEYEVVDRFPSATEYRDRYPSVLVHGTVTKLHAPRGPNRSRYTNHLFWERVRAFQADLLYGDVEQVSDLVQDYEANGVAYKLFVRRLARGDGSTGYVFAMTSLQPVNEAVGVMRQYYGYVIVGSVLLALLASFYYARRIANPLLRFNEVTQRMANLDFSVRLPVTTQDEIGSLARNINELSGLLHAHIVRLEQDIEHEKRLERTRKEFIAGVSHELRTPLSVIESCLYMLQAKPDSKNRAHYFAAIQDEVQKMNLLITDMLELAKYESGRYTPEMAPFRIDTLVERVCQRVAPEIAGKGLCLHTDLSSVEVVGNERLMEQVVVNFVTNAVHYTPEGQEVTITTSGDGERVKLCVENKGARIPEDQLERVWERFYRGESSRHRSTGGTGLGLAISKRILELHKASYGVTNTADGVLFHFTLTRSEPKHLSDSASF